MKTIFNNYRKNSIKKVAVVFVTALSLCVSPIADVKSKNIEINKVSIKKLLKNMEKAEISILTEKSTRNKKKWNIKLSNNNMARFSALSINVDDDNGIRMGEFGYETFSFSDDDLNNTSLEMFGRMLGKEDVSSTKQVSWTYDVFKSKGEIVIYKASNEGETSYSATGYRFSSGSDFIDVTKKIYYGYWGRDNGKPNYKIKYTLALNDESSYGYKITGMKIRKI